MMDLKTVRVLSRRTQWQIALSLGCSQSRISLIENGLIQPRKEERERIAEILKLMIALWIESPTRDWKAKRGKE